jgi:hypothetical protein
MARIEVTCPYCQSLQNVPEKRLHEPWVCMKCRGTIDDPFLHKKKSPPPKLQIPLHGKIISASGITNLSEIVAASEEYSRGFDPSTIMVPQGFELGAYTPPPETGLEGRRNRRLGVLAVLAFALVIVAGLVVYYLLVLQPHTA